MGSSDFRMIRPIAVTDATLTSCTVPEAVVTEYSGASTYGLGDIRGVTSGTAQAVYQSLQAPNTAHAPASSPTWWQLLGTVYAAYSSGTSYSLGAIVSDLVTHQLYESLTGANLGNSLSDPLKWNPLGATNRWKQFDKAVNSQTSAPEVIITAVTPGEIANTLIGLNVSGATATLTQSVSGYSISKSLVTHDVLNWYDYWYEDPVYSTDVVFIDIPPYPGSTLTLTISSPGGTASIGCCFVGKSRTLGKTNWGLTGGVLSYSGRTEDAFGNVTLVKRNKAKRLSFKVYIEPGFESEAYRLLDEYTDVEMVIIGAEDYSLTYSYGYLGQWIVPVSDSGEPATIEFKGLT